LAPDHGQCVVAEDSAIRRLELELPWLKHLACIAHGAVQHAERGGVQLDRHRIAVNRVPLGILHFAADGGHTGSGVAFDLLWGLDHLVFVYGLGCVGGWWWLGRGRRRWWPRSRGGGRR